ncbi:MAG: MFS transporter [Nocardioidaceae bacterium]
MTNEAPPQAGQGHAGRLQRLLPETQAARVMALATLVNTAGSGSYMVVAVLYFTRIVGLSPTQVGVGLSVAGLFGILSGVPMGHLGDKRGARELLIMLLVLAAPVAAAAALVTNATEFVLAASGLAVLDRGSAAVRAGLIASASVGPERIRTRAYLRSVTNIGITIGAGIGALALLADTRAAYVVLLLINALTYLATAVVLRRHPHVPPTPKHEAAPIWQVFRDRPYVVVTILMASMAIQYSILDVGIPLWVDRYTSAPTWVVSVLFVVNTVTVVLFQVRVSRRVEHVATAAKVISSSGFVFFAACGLLALAAGRSVATAVALLLAGGLMHAFGELLQAAAQFCLGQELAPGHAQGQYQGLASTGFSLSTMLAPTVITLLPITLGALGWWLLGGVFVALGLALVPAVGWAARTRPDYASVVLPAGG